MPHTIPHKFERLLPNLFNQSSDLHDGLAADPGNVVRSITRFSQYYFHPGGCLEKETSADYILSKKGGLRRLQAGKK